MPRMPMVEHYLITIPLNDGFHLHGYVMTDDGKAIPAVLNQMMEIAETSGPLRLPMILQTKLTTGTDLVRSIIISMSAEAEEKLRTATDFHFSVFAMIAGDPRDVQLMELH